MTLLSKLEVRFHNAGHKNVKFVIVTDSALNAQRLRGYSRQLQVFVVKDQKNSQFAQLEDRSVYIFDACGQLAYIIHFPYSSVHKPFIKAAVLSVIYDEPCGYCESMVSDKNNN